MEIRGPLQCTGSKNFVRTLPKFLLHQCFPVGTLNSPILPRRSQSIITVWYTTHACRIDYILLERGTEIRYLTISRFATHHILTFDITTCWSALQRRARLLVGRRPRYADTAAHRNLCGPMSHETLMRPPPQPHRRPGPTQGGHLVRNHARAGRGGLGRCSIDGGVTLRLNAERKREGRLRRASGARRELLVRVRLLHML